MSTRRSGFLLGALALVAATGALANSDGTRTANLPFNDCMSIISEISADLGEEPVVLVKTSDIHSVRIDAEDGYVTVSCSRPDNKMTLTKTGSTVTAGLASPRP